MDELINLSNEIDVEIKNLKDRLDVNTTNAQDDANRATLQSLYDKLTDAKMVEKTAPGNRQDAEVAYYKYVYGDKYQSQLGMWYYTESSQLYIQLVQQKNGVMTQINEGILYLSSQLTYLKQLERVAGLPSGKQSVEEIKLESTATSIRKAGFFGESDAMVLIWTNIMNCIIFVYGCLLLFVLRTKLTEPKVFITILITFMSVFALDFFLKFIYVISSLFI